MSRPNSGDYPEYFKGYINRVTEDDLKLGFSNQSKTIDELTGLVNEEQSLKSYAPGKWTPREMLQHIIDAERIFAYRALCIARKEQQSLPSFEENDYAVISEANNRSWKDLCAEFKNVRISSIDLFHSFSDQMLQNKGKANNKEMTVLSLGYISIGHVYHHINVLKERYLHQ